MDGTSLVPLLSTPGSPWREDFLIEHLKGSAKDPVPTFCAVRTTRYKFVSFATGEREFYDLVADPYELRSAANDPAYAATVAQLRTRLALLCNPPPPGFTTVPGF